MMTAKAAASVDTLSGGRLILGVASGDRTVEYPLLGLDFDTRAERFRDTVSYMRQAWQPGGLPFEDRRIPRIRPSAPARAGNDPDGRGPVRRVRRMNGLVPIWTAGSSIPAVSGG